MLSVKQGGIKYHFFWVFAMTRSGIETQSPGPLLNTQRGSCLSQGCSNVNVIAQLESLPDLYATI